MCKRCKCVWIAVIVLASVYLLYDYYSDNYCKDVAIPVKCSK